MKLELDSIQRTLTVVKDGTSVAIPLYSREAFELLSAEWLRVGWAEKYSYTFTWMGRPVIQLPEDLLRFQEVVYQIRPDVIIETGIAHGGSLLYYASLCHLIGHGRVIGIDIEIQPHNRHAIESHQLASLVTLVEGSSIDPAIVGGVKARVKPSETAMVLLDSNHSRRHVLEELRAYHSLVSPGSYLVVADGIMRDLTDVPGGSATWESDGPLSAVAEFLSEHPEFIRERPAWRFNESALGENVTYWPQGWLRRQ